MSDYISREEALNFELSVEADPEDIQAITKGMALYAEHIKNIPAAEVVGRPLYDHAIRHAVRLSTERKIGKWSRENLVATVGGTYSVVRCSECKAQFPFWETKFCPNCGADMRGEA